MLCYEGREIFYFSVHSVFLVNIIKDKASLLSAYQGSMIDIIEQKEKVTVRNRVRGRAKKKRKGRYANLQRYPLLLGPAGISLGLGFPVCRVRAKLNPQSILRTVCEILTCRSWAVPYRGYSGTAE